jgi:hypothetical protein
MNKRNFVRVICDVFCKWDDTSPVYRCYVNDELFAERTWIWRDIYLEENLQIEAVPGQYPIRFEFVEEVGARLKVKNIRVDHGPGRIINNSIVEIWNEST